MLVVVSPAKKLNETPSETGDGTEPFFADEAKLLAKYAGALDAGDLMKLMHISEALGKLNAARFAQFGTAARKPAIEMFDGDTYTGFDAPGLDPDAMAYAQSHLRILSGLYGLLRPRDLIAPHRLEMGTRMKTPRGKSLYEFWGNRVAERLSEEAKALGTRWLVNCASVEYFTVANRDTLALDVVTPKFFETKNGEPRVVSFYAKQARGAMARFICEHRLTDPADLADFNAGGYEYQPGMSRPEEPVFLRGELAQNAA